MAQTYDINTSGKEDLTTTPPTLAGATFSPLRYTTSTLDEIRVGVWLLLSTRIGTYRLDVAQGLDIEAILDSGASDTERSAIVAEIVLDYPGVIGITEGPTVTVSDNGELVSISLAAETSDGTFNLAGAFAP